MICCFPCANSECSLRKLCISYFSIILDVIGVIAAQEINNLYLWIQMS